MFVVSCLFDDSHFNRCGMIVWFSFAFPWLMVLSIFLYNCWQSLEKSFLWKIVYSDPLPFFNWIVWGFAVEFCVLYISWILSSYQIYDLQIFFSHSVYCFFILLMFPSLCRSFSGDVIPLFIFAFVSFAFGVQSKKLSPRLMSRNLSPIFLLGVLWFQMLHSNL